MRASGGGVLPSVTLRSSSARIERPTLATTTHVQTAKCLMDLSVRCAHVPLGRRTFYRLDVRGLVGNGSNTVTMWILTATGVVRAPCADGHATSTSESCDRAFVSESSGGRVAALRLGEGRRGCRGAG